MNLLLDTHALIWWMEGNPRLSPKAKRAISNSANTIYVSAASTWEIALKVSSGKLVIARPLATLESEIQNEGFVAVPITVEHSIEAGRIVGPSKDPFDRMLAAQCRRGKLAMVSSDHVFDALGVSRIWS